MVDLLTSVARLGQPRILVVGDAMLDRYTWGNAERVSPEAPVVILRADEREVRLGGAASVAVLLRALEANVTLAAVVGDDHDGRTICRLLDESQIGGSLLVDPHRHTTTKDRFLGCSENGQPHQMLRVDTESRAPLDRDLEERLLAELSATIPDHEAVLISDYGKGVCTERVVGEVIKHCRDAAIPVLVDPARGVSLERYRYATLMKPNRLEAEAVLGRKIRSYREAIQAACELRERYQFESVLITIDRDGMVFASVDADEHLPITPRAICDITGAGDTVLATLGLGFASQLPLSTSAHLANVAAGIQVSQLGVTPIAREQLVHELCGTNAHVRASTPIISPWPCGKSDRVRRFSEDASSIGESASPCSSELSNASPFHSPASQCAGARPFYQKLLTADEAKNLAVEYRRTGKTIVFTNGCFDLLHVGHVTMLEESARMGDILFVAINSDSSVRCLKGNDRPVVHEQDRACMLSALACVDHVLIFGDATPHRLLEAIRPDILVKGGSTKEIVGREVVEAYGGQIKRTMFRPNSSTTQLVERVRTHALSTEEQS